ncbi:very-long-chain aldehyde decarbonylase GL1-9-like [Zingiber officinale]|uniref:very-long-chain aldehyde decarbonylase GL1-9-like n=1 Tax=Zingiber officinale TaxID=94328 RepID=UPI001C4CDBBB|nr:very-long-chain aldehyde decarbonylase GL1-9-like [Zingiber officinale]
MKLATPRPFSQQLTGDDPNYRPPRTTATSAARFFVAVVVFDSWPYFIHRYMHHNKVLYRSFHSWHHGIAAPYALAEQYKCATTPIDGVLTGTVSGALAYFVSGMSPVTAFGNNAAYLPRGASPAVRCGEIA